MAIISYVRFLNNATNSVIYRIIYFGKNRCGGHLPGIASLCYSKNIVTYDHNKIYHPLASGLRFMRCNAQLMCTVNVAETNYHQREHIYSYLWLWNKILGSYWHPKSHLEFLIGILFFVLVK